jgi:hypothetical protein
MVVRYPVPLTASAQAADDITRRLIDTLNREPGVRLVAQSAPTLQRADSAEIDATSAAVRPEQSEHPDSSATSSPAPAPPSDGNAGITPAAAAISGAAGLAAASVVDTAVNPPATPSANPPKP